MEPLGERPVWSMGDSELLPTLDQVDAAVAWLLTYRLQLVARIDETRPLRPAQANAIVTALERVRSRVPVEDLDVAEEQLVNLAGHLCPGELAKAAKEICDLLDSDGPEPDENAAYERESLTLIEAENGVKFRGYLANEHAELLRSRVHAVARPHKTVDGELDPRSREKRQADALTSTLTIAAAKANITVTIDFEDLKSAAAGATGDLVYGDGLSAAAIRRMACDARIIPLVLGSNSEPLDVGRAERLVTRAMRRALNVRDKGCVVCGAPPIHCDAHHLRSWIDGGETAIHNLVLLCRGHHRSLHDGHWIITITDGHVQVSRPSWADPPPQPRPTVSALLAATAAPRPEANAATGPAVRSRRSGRWSADEATMQEAARFAVRGDPSTDPPPTQDSLISEDLPVGLR